MNKEIIHREAKYNILRIVFQYYREMYTQFNYNFDFDRDWNKFPEKKQKQFLEIVGNCLACFKLGDFSYLVRDIHNSTNMDSNNMTNDLLVGDNLLDILKDVQEEVEKATSKWPPINSAHEGYGLIMEELKELEEHVFMKQTKRDLDEMKKEAIQVAAMAVRFAHDVIDGGRGRK